MESDKLKTESNNANVLLSAVLFVKKEIQKDKEIARLAPESEYKEGYLKAMTNVTAIMDEYLLSKYCR